jgi:hypothetical protein
VRSERDGLAAELTRKQKRQLRGGFVRRTTVLILVALFAILLPITLTMGWAHRTVLNTDAYVNTVKPIAQDPAVTDAVSRQITDQVYVALDPRTAIADALPPRASFLAGPISNGVKNFVQQRVDRILQTPQFQQIWLAANRDAHAQLVSVLRGHSNVVVTNNSQVVLNLVPLLNSVLKELQQPASQLVSRDITLPQLSGNELPSVACEKIANALNRPLPPTCGQIVLFPSDKLDNARRAVTAFDRAVIGLLIVTPLLAIAAVALSRRRRRTLIQLLVAGSLALVIIRRAVFWLQDQLVARGVPENKDARRVIVHDVLRNFFGLTFWVLIGALVLLILALVTGPYAWARKVRDGVGRSGVWVRNTAVELGQTVSGKARDEGTVRWINDHVDLLRIAGVVVVVLFLLLGTSFLGFLVLVGLLALYQLWLHRVHTQSGRSESGTGEAPPSVGGSAPGSDVPPQRA